MSIVPLSVVLPLLTGALPGGPVTEHLSAFLHDEAPGLLERAREPGLAVVLVEDGRVTLCEGLGVADRASGAPVTPDTLFNVGSLSKTVTAWVVGHAVDQGDLALDQPVGGLLDDLPLPGTPDEQAGLTIRRLLSHTAGVGLPSVDGYPVDGEVPDARELLANLGPLVAPPGTRFAYSGGGYGLLQLAVEAQAGRPFAEVARTTVLQPLGMERSRFGAPVGAGELATAYSVRLALEGGEPQPGGVAVPLRDYPLQAAAGFWTSARDLGRFLQAHVEGEDGEPAGRGVVRPELLARMGTPCPPATEYGLGYELPPPLDGHPVLMHTGTNLGWKAHVIVIPELGLALGALTNTDAGEALHAVMFRFRDEAVARSAAAAGR